MHRVLSYQTAMRAGGSRDIREYVTKRTCVSLILSIAFFTLIAGFLLGKFVSDRQHHMKHMSELDSADEYLGYKEAKERLMKTAQDLTTSLEHNNENSSKYISLNAKIYNHYISCIQILPNKSSLKIDTFVQNLLTSQTSMQLQCLSTLKDFIHGLL